MTDNINNPRQLYDVVLTSNPTSNNNEHDDDSPLPSAPPCPAHLLIPPPPATSLNANRVAVPSESPSYDMAPQGSSPVVGVPLIPPQTAIAATAPTSTCAPVVLTYPTTHTTAQQQMVLSGANRMAGSGGPDYPMREWGKTSLLVSCPSCGFTGYTDIQMEDGFATWAACLCLFCFFWPLCWLPFCMDDLKDHKHFCTNCHAKLGTHRVF